MDNARTTSNRLRTENQELKTGNQGIEKRTLGKMKDLFNSEQLEALRHHFPNISKLWKRERPTQANHQKQRFRHGYVESPPPPRPPGATKRQLTQWSVTPFGFGRNFAGSSKTVVRWPRKVWQVYVTDGWSCPLPLALPDR